MIVVESAGPADTRRLGRALAALARKGDIILLTGPLGAGKTVMAGGIAEGLGVGRPAVSPSFVLVHTYEDGFMPLIHADVYRISSSAEFEDLDLLEAAREGLLMIEWGDTVAAWLPDRCLTVEITGVGAEVRTVRFDAGGPWSERSLAGLMAPARIGRSD